MFLSTKVHNMYLLKFYMARLARFGRAYAGVKVPCLTTWLQAYINGGCCTLYTSIETTNKHRCRHQSYKGKPFVQQHLILTLLAQNTVLETDGFHHTSLSRRVSDLLSLFCIFHEQFFTVMLSTIQPFQSRFSGAG